MNLMRNRCSQQVEDRERTVSSPNNVCLLCMLAPHQNQLPSLPRHLADYISQHPLYSWFSLAIISASGIKVDVMSTIAWQSRLTEVVVRHREREIHNKMSDQWVGR